VKVNTPVDSSFFKGFTVTGEADYLYELSNKINFTAQYNLTYLKPVNVDGISTQALTAGFLFYIENNINYGFQAGYTKVGSADATETMSMTLQYNLFY